MRRFLLTLALLLAQNEYALAQNQNPSVIVIGPVVSGNCVKFGTARNQVQDAGQPCAAGGATGANPTAIIGLSAINGTSPSFMRADAAPPLSQAINPTWTGTHLFQPATGGTTFRNMIAPGPIITLTGLANSLTQGIVESLSVSGTSAGIDLNHWGINDAGNFSTVTNGFQIAHVYGGAPSAGPRQTFVASLDLSGAIGGATNPFLVASVANITAHTNLGGGVGTERGSVIALNANATALSGATNLQELSGLEIIVTGSNGATYLGRQGIEITDASGSGAPHGSTFDNAITLDQGAGAPGWNCALCNNGTLNLASAIDFSSATIANYFLRGPGNFNVTGAGSVGIGLNPLFKLHIQGTDGVNAIVINSSGGNNVFQMRSSSVGAGIFDLTNSGGTPVVELRGDANMTAFNVPIGIGPLTGVAGTAGELYFAKTGPEDTTAPGAGIMRFQVISNAGGGCDLVARAGSSTTKTTIASNVGAGC